MSRVLGHVRESVLIDRATWSFELLPRVVCECCVLVTSSLCTAFNGPCDLCCTAPVCFRQHNSEVYIVVGLIHSNDSSAPEIEACA